MHCQQFTLKCITLAYQIVHAKPVLLPGLISLHYSEFVSNKHSIVPSVSGLSVAAGPQNNVPVGPHSHRSCCPQTPNARKLFGYGFRFLGVYTPCWGGSRILVLRFPHSLHEPTQNSKDLEKSINSCVPRSQKSYWGTQRATAP